MNGGDVFERRDSAIKLFGKTISASESHAPVTAAEKSDVGFRIPDKPQPLDVCSEISKVEANAAQFGDCGNQAKSSVAEDGDGDKVLKKPDKIIACPRCDSMDTKFCYFNNYNVNQPRHFCKNCQRYWTAGGTMRNVPVGAGRRKNKQFASQYGQILVSAPSTQQVTPMEVPDSTDLRPPSSVESENAFGTLTIDGKTPKLGPRKMVEREKREEPSSCVSSVTSSSVQENQIATLTQPNHTQWYPVPPWVVPSSQVWNGGAPPMAGWCSSELSAAPSVGNPDPARWCTPQLVAVPGFSTPNIPLQFVPASYLGCLPIWAGGAIQKPMVVSDDGRSPSSSTSNACSGNNLPILGKHSRSEDLFGEETPENRGLGPKISRVDETKFKCGMFRPFKSTADCKDLSSDKTEVLEANPAALSRSHTFQEST